MCLATVHAAAAAAAAVLCSTASSLHTAALDACAPRAGGFVAAKGDIRCSPSCNTLVTALGPTLVVAVLSNNPPCCLFRPTTTTTTATGSMLNYNGE